MGEKVGQIVNKICQFSHTKIVLNHKYGLHRCTNATDMTITYCFCLSYSELNAKYAIAYLVCCTFRLRSIHWIYQRHYRADGGWKKL